MTVRSRPQGGLVNPNSLFQARNLRFGPSVSVAAVVILLTVLSTGAVGQVSVTISPSVVNLATLATQPFTAAVIGSSNTAVTWQVNGMGGCNDANGRVSTTVLGTANEAFS